MLCKLFYHVHLNFSLKKLLHGAGDALDCGGLKMQSIWSHLLHKSYAVGWFSLRFSLFNRMGADGLLCALCSMYLWKGVPDVAIPTIFAYLDIKKLCECCCVCKKWENFVHKRMADMRIEAGTSRAQVPVLNRVPENQLIHFFTPLSSFLLCVIDPKAFSVVLKELCGLSVLAAKSGRER